LATPLALVEAEIDFDKNPRLATAVGFLLPAPSGLNRETAHEQDN